MKIRGIILLCIALLLVALMTILGGYKGIVRFQNVETLARVTKYAQDPPGKIRHGDWRMTFTFTDELGEEFNGETTFAPKNRPHEDIAELPILYFPLNPNIHEIKGNVSTTGIKGYCLALCIVFLSIRTFTSQRKETSNG